MRASTENQYSNIERRRREALLSGDQNYLDRRRELLRVAGILFREKGFDATTVNDLAKAIGVDRATLYYYTSGKEELFHEMVREATEQNTLNAERILESDLSTREKIDAFITSLMKSYEEHYPYLHVYVQEFMTKVEMGENAWAEEMRALSLRFNVAVIGIIQQGIDNGSIRPDAGTARMIANAIIGMCNWSHRWFQLDGEQSAESIGHVFSGIVSRGICV